MKQTQDQHGQSIIIIALGLAVLMAFMALAVDGGNVYAQRRQVQNAVDAAALAGGERLARPDPTTNGRATNGQVLSVVKQYLKNNNVNPDATNAGLRVRYVVRNSSNNQLQVDTQDIWTYGSNATAPVRIPQTSTGHPVVGVSVTVDREFNSFFANIIGIRTMSVGANGPGYGAPITTSMTPGPPSTGACCADELFPFAFSNGMFQDLNGDGNPDVTFEEASAPYTPVPANEYMIWERRSSSPGNYFVYVRWKNQSGNSSTLQNNINNYATNVSGTWYVEEYLPGADATAIMGTGSTCNSICTALRSKIGQSFTVPIYDSSRNSNTEFHIVGFARFQLTGVCKYNNYTSGSCTNRSLQSNSDAYIQGRFEQWTSSRCEGSCAFYGVRTNKPHDGLPQERALAGVVKIYKESPLNIEFSQMPVDVVHVLDISGSMRYCIGTTTDCTNTNSNQKLNLAKNALITFNSLTQPNLTNRTLGDQVGLATFPQTASTSSYSMPCGNSYNVLMTGQNRKNLTNVITPTNTSGTVNNIINGLSADSGTPLAGGILVGRQMVLNPSYRVPGHQAVLIIASDGIANVRTNGRWTGFSGTTYSDPPCNSDAIQDAIQEANVAKQDNNGDGKPDVVVFTIAIGTDFNASVLQAIASPPVSNHFFTATDRASMENIYNQIATRLATGDCTATAQEAFAPNAVVRVRNNNTGQILQTTTTSTGAFVFDNIEPGTYEFISVSVTISGFTYDIFTNGVGGPDLTSNPTIEVGQAPTTYPINLSLRTDDFACSP